MEFLTLYAIIILALMSPGPDFAVIVRSSLMYSRKEALLTAFGVALGILFHTSYLLFGTGLLHQYFASMLIWIKYLGAAYLIYLGCRSLLSKKTTLSFSDVKHQKTNKLKAFNMGLMTGVLNPKTMLFFASILSVMIKPGVSTLELIESGSIIFLEALCWFSLVAFIFTSQYARQVFYRFGYVFEKITGVVLIFIALELILR